MQTGTNVVAECASLREEAARKEYTIAQAIQDAMWVRRTPDAVISPARAKQMITTLLSGIESSRCFLKALQNGEEVFVLRSIDRAAPFGIVAWADAAAERGCRAEKLDDAYRISGRWTNQPAEKTKWPD